MSKSNVARSGCADATPDGESPVKGLSPANWAELAKRAISPEVAIAVGVRDCVDHDHDGLIVPYRANGTVVDVYRLSQAERDARDDDMRYRFPPGKTPPISEIRELGDGGPVALCEGSLQPLAVASSAPDGWSVHGMNGNYGWSGADLTAYAGREVVIWADKDVKTNPDVHDAMAALAEKLDECGATSVRHVRMTARGKTTGADDYLAEIKDPAKRPAVVGRLLDKAGALPPKPRAKRKVKTGPGGAIFIDSGKLQAETLTRAVLAASPAALTPEGKIAMYEDGRYHPNGKIFSLTVARLLGEDFRPGHRAAAEEFAVDLLYADGRRLPEVTAEPLLNVRNGMVHLPTGELRPHSPDYLSAVQLPVDYDPAATCPGYEKWLQEVIPEQIDDLEETCAAMLDPSRTPTKAAFLFGPSRSGKSTYLRLLGALAGRGHTSAVTLHQLSTDKHAAANVYASILNAAADMSSAHVEDLSTFKMLTGDDLIQANRKYGHEFAFRNRALFVFSANELPTVSESSGAYSERIKPFHFDRSFAGHEDQSIEVRMMGELPGILARLVRAWQRRNERGRYLATATPVREEFEQGSNRVLLWLSERGRITTRPDGTAPAPRAVMPDDRCTQPRFLAQMFNAWAQEQGGSMMGERKIIKRLTSVDGVERVRNQGKSQALNIIVWGVGEEMPDDGDGAEGAETTHPFHARARARTHTGAHTQAGEGCAVSAPSAPIKRSFEQ